MFLDNGNLPGTPYTVSTAVFEGPLDLLLHLIEREELDITKLALAKVTNQYLTFIRGLTKHSADEVSEFLIVAAKLIQIKSEALLPAPPKRDGGEEEEDPGEALARQLIAYKRYKEISDILRFRVENGFQTYLRLAASPKVEGKLDLEGIGVVDLVNAIHYVYAMGEKKTPLGNIVVAPRVTIREKIAQIVTSIRTLGRVSFRKMLGGTSSRMEIVVAFLAVLELVKSRRIIASQKSLFTDFELERAEAWTDEEMEIESEFGE